MLTLSETAACEWAASGVRVNTVAPCGIASSGFDTCTPEAKATILAYPPTVPLQRYGSESELSAAIVVLLSRAAACITGTCVRVDGGTPNARHLEAASPPKQPARHGLSPGRMARDAEGGRSRGLNGIAPLPHGRSASP